MMRTPVALIILLYLCIYLWKNASTHLSTLKHQRAGYDPLQAKNIMRPSITFAPNTPVEVVAQSIGTDFIATTQDPRTGHMLWADGAMLHAVPGRSLVHVSVSLAEPSISYNSLRYDVLEHLNGTHWNRLPHNVKQNPTTLAWAVTDAHQRPIGIITHNDATTILNRENQMLGLNHQI